MKKTLFLLLIIYTLLPSVAFAHAWGVVLDENGEPLVGANVYWAHTTSGTSTDANGQFKLEPVHSTKLLVTSFVGYHNDTTEVRSHEALTIVLVNADELDEVTITERKMSVIKSRTSALNVETLTGEALCKAACCNLSESFEQSASVDVAYSDAATGAKQIKLLGLAGTYVQLLTENTPGVRGLAQNFGLEYIPGPWMSSIQVSKGTSSVINGYEATSGQINVEYLKPQTQDPIAINAMLNTELHAEINITGGWNINEHVSTGLLVHAQDASYPMDDNHDTFLDMPKNHHLNLLNRWYIKKGDYTGQILVRGLYDQRIGGQNEKFMTPGSTQELYGIDLRTRRLEGFVKNGYVFDEDMGTSIGIIASGCYHSQTNIYGHRKWDAAQGNAYLNAIFQTNFEDHHLEDSQHKLSAGLSMNFDDYKEILYGLHNNSDIDTLDRWDITPGIFAEYTYTYGDKLTLLLGVRGDYSTRYGFFCTPRMNVRYSPWTWWVIRASAGLGYRSPNVIADYAGYLPSNREWVLPTDYKFKQERALNAGVTTTFYIPLGSKELQLSGEYYYTHFFNCVIADIDNNQHQVLLHDMGNLDKSFAHNVQAEADMEILKGWNMTLAFRYTDIKQTSQEVGGVTLLDKALSNKFKGIISTSYQTPHKKWQFDFTAQFNGYGRMPVGFVPQSFGQYYEKNGYIYHKWYPQLLAQITKYWETCSLYVGSENMTNFRQDNPISGAAQPFSNSDFDASMVWGPIHGWKIYAGFRWALPADKKDAHHKHDEHHNS